MFVNKFRNEMSEKMILTNKVDFVGILRRTVATSLQLLEPLLKYSLSKMKRTREQDWPPSESRPKVVSVSRS